MEEEKNIKYGIRGVRGASATVWNKNGKKNINVQIGFKEDDPILIPKNGYVNIPFNLNLINQGVKEVMELEGIDELKGDMVFKLGEF